MALETPTWLNLCFVEKILRKSEGDNSIQVIDIFAKPATSKGDNYTSDMIRVTAEFSRDQGDRKITEKKSIIFKVSPLTEGIRQDLVSWFNLNNAFNTDKLNYGRFHYFGVDFYLTKRSRQLFGAIDDWK